MGQEVVSTDKAPRPTEADMEALAEQVWASFKTSPFFHVTRPFAKSIASTVLTSDWLAARDAEHQREVEALREVLRIGVELDNHHNADACPYCTGGIRARAEAAERDRDEARRELADLRAMVADMRAGIWRLGESIHGDEGVEHVEGCEGEPTCFACILADLRALLPTEDDQ